MTTQKSIEYLQKPENARQYRWLLRRLPDHARVIEQAYHAGQTLYLDPSGEWLSPAICHADICDRDCYIIAPGYKPEPEYEKCRIERISGCICLYAKDVPHKDGVPEPHAINIACQLPDFVGFFDKDGKRLAIDEVATALREEKEPYAKLLKSE